MARPNESPVAEENTAPDIATLMRRIGEAARRAGATLAIADSAAKDGALRAGAAAIRDSRATLLEANGADMAAAKDKGLTAAMLDRLALDGNRIEAMASGLEDIAGLADPIGAASAEWTRPNGLRIARVRVPLGVIGIIYESRPNVTADAGGLCLKSGNATILRGGSESARSSAAIIECLHSGLAAASLPKTAIQGVPTTDRAAVGEMLTMVGLIDVIVPRGGKSLIERVQRESRLPVIGHLEGICHTYIDGGADLDMARRIAVNAKMRRTGICGATETLLVDRRVADTHLAPLIDDLVAAGCEIRGDATAQAADSRVVAATEADWSTEYLDAVISVRVVDGVDAAIDHIARHGSRHTDAIVTGDAVAAKRFLDRVDSAIVLHNASTQYADGGEFGMGAEIGISTDKFHARGPVGAEQLTSYKYVVHGSGQVRP